MSLKFIQFYTIFITAHLSYQIVLSMKSAEIVASHKTNDNLALLHPSIY